MDRLAKKRRKLVFINIFLLILVVLGCNHVLSIEKLKKYYAPEVIRIYEEYKNPIFKINKIEIWAGAYAVDNSDGELKDIDISQFSDLIIYINNHLKDKELSPENTISDLYIDNIKVEIENVNTILNYKNPYNIGKYVELENFKDNKIQYNIINSNEKNEKADYNNNVFFTDCSNPITIGLINKNILTKCEASNVGSLNFDGSILKLVNIDLKKLETKISFRINITNNYGEKYETTVNSKIDLTKNNNAIYNGFAKYEIIPENDEYNFVRTYK